MTLMPVEPSRVTIDTRRYVWCVPLELPNRCQVPGCLHTWNLQGHHVVPRSRTGGPLDYITVDGVVVQNVYVLCSDHHDQITGLLGGHKAVIRWEPGRGWLWFRRMQDTGVGLELVAWQDKLGGWWQEYGPLA